MPRAKQDEAPSLLSELGHRIEAVCKLLGTRKNAALIADISTDQLARYFKGESKPGLEAVAKMCEHAGVSLDWLWSGEGEMLRQRRAMEGAPRSRPEEDFDLVPLYEAVASAGPGTVGNGDGVVAQMAFRRQWLQRVGLHPKNLAMIHARGDSMWPTISDGDVLLMDATLNTPDGGIYVVRIGEELRAKRLQRLIDGSVRVSSDNKIYADEVIDASDLWQLSVLGKVIWVGGLI